jgi:hypothetical protein
MPAKKSNPEKRQTKKAKPAARSQAAERMNNVPKIGGRARVGPGGENQRSQGRFPGETPLTGEDRPANRAGGKNRGQTTRR